MKAIQWKATRRNTPSKLVALTYICNVYQKLYIKIGSFLSTYFFQKNRMAFLKHGVFSTYDYEVKEKIAE